MTSVPTSAGEITAQWLTEVLESRYPGTVVTDLTRGTEIHGTATKLRLLLQYNDAGHAHGLPPTMWFKGGLEAHSLTRDMLIVYASEAAFFEQVAPTLAINIPKAHAAFIDPASNHSFVVLEDLLDRNATFGHASRPMRTEEVALLLGELAALHARYWRSAEIDRFAWLKQGGSLLQSCEVLIQPATWERCMALPRGRFVTGPLRDFELMRRSVLNVLRTDNARATCLVHGDSHIGNTYRTRDGAMGFLDWQSTFYGMWAHDVTYLMITSMTIEDRRRHERDLLNLYIAEARGRGIDLPWDEAWLEYRRHVFYACSWAMCLPEWQAEETCCLVTERAFAAASDLDSLDA